MTGHALKQNIFLKILKAWKPGEDLDFQFSVVRNKHHGMNSNLIVSWKTRRGYRNEALSLESKNETSYLGQKERKEILNIRRVQR